MISIEFSEDYIALIYKGMEIVGWHEREWIEDPQVVFSICNAILLSRDNPAQLLAKLGVGPNHPIRAKGE